MSETLETVEQRAKFFNALEIFLLNELSENTRFEEAKRGFRALVSRKPSSHNHSIAYLIIRSEIIGEVKGRLRERRRNQLEISKQVLTALVDDVQASEYHGLNPEELPVMQGFIARLSVYLEDAFDIAINDKEMPKQLGQITEGKILKG